MTKRPWFSLYVADWIMATASMTLEEQGAYMRLLALQWAEGSISWEPRRVALKLGVPLDYYQRELAPMVESHFSRCEDGRLRNPRLEREREEAEAISQTNSINGKKRAEGERDGNGRYTSTSDRASDSPAVEPPKVQPSQSQSQSQERSTLAQPTAARVSFDFGPLYRQYPNKKGKAAGLKKLKALVRTEAEFQALKHGLECFIRDEKRKGTEVDFYPHFSTWVNKQRWLDYVDDGGLFATVVAKSPAQLLAEESKRQRLAEFEGQP